MLSALGTAALTCSNVSLPDDIRSAVRMAPMPFSALLSSISRLATTCWSSSMGLKDKQSGAGCSHQWRCQRARGKRFHGHGGQLLRGAAWPLCFVQALATCCRAPVLKADYRPLIAYL